MIPDRPFPIGLRAWTLLQYLTEAWVDRSLQPPEVATVRRSEWRRRGYLEDHTFDFSWERVEFDNKTIHFAVVGGRGNLEEAGRSAGAEVREIVSRPLRARLWLMPEPLAIGALTPKQRERGDQLYEGEFHDGEIDWRIHGADTFDLFSLTPLSVPSEFEHVLRKMPRLYLLIG